MGRKKNRLEMNGELGSRKDRRGDFRVPVPVLSSWLLRLPGGAVFAGPAGLLAVASCPPQLLSQTAAVSFVLPT